MPQELFNAVQSKLAGYYKEKEVGMQKRRIYKYVNFRYLSPKIIKDIFDNKNPNNFRLKELLDIAEYANFSDQEKEWCNIY